LEISDMNPPSPTGLPDFNALWDYPQPAQTEQRFRELLPAARASGDRDYYLQLLTQIARAQCLQKQYDQSHATLDHVRDELTDDLKTVKVRYLLERGRCFNDSAQYEKSKAAFLNALELAKQHHLDGYAVDAAHMMGIIEPPDEALAWNVRAVTYAKASQDPSARRWLATLQNNIGWTYFKMAKYDDALTVFQEALELRKAQGKPGPIRIARWSVAKIQRMLGQVETALKEQQALLAECERAREDDGYTHEETAECLLTLDRIKEAQPHFAKAYEKLSKDPWFPPDETARLTRLKELGQIREKNLLP
jgi:tetratricopeptide (TPR) repeat protein